MLQSFIDKCDSQMLSDTISSYLTDIFRTKNIRNEDCVNLYNDLLSLPHNEWIKEICCNDETCEMTVFNEYNVVQVLTEYENGTSRLFMKDGKFYWEDAAKDTGYRCAFSRMVN